MLTPIPTRPRLCTASSNRVVVVASRYNREFVEPMVTRTVEELAAIEPATKVEVVHAPGSFEIPYLAANSIAKLKPDAVICLGVIFRGETGHADLIAASVSDALCRLSVDNLGTRHPRGPPSGPSGPGPGTVPRHGDEPRHRGGPGRGRDPAHVQSPLHPLVTR